MCKTVVQTLPGANFGANSGANPGARQQVKSYHPTLLVLPTGPHKVQAHKKESAKSGGECRFRHKVAQEEQL